MLDVVCGGVPPKCVLLAVGATEDGVAHTVEDDNGCEGPGRKVRVVLNQIAGLLLLGQDQEDGAV